mmetsp:Transcript_4271/g.8886  ORF Transcript_4271/g.8886 Transcript_4271/m.8886 type:complete len:314 (-) Transcript_4271:287-1228(-)
MDDLTFETAACGIVALAALNLALKAVSHVYKTFLRPAKNLKKYGKWAVVTGATDGIGKAYAFAFAKKGMSVLLISRTESKLQDVKKEIEEKHDGVEVDYLVCDYSKFDKAAQDKVAKVVTGLEVGVLVNNVGVSYRYPMFFHELKDDEVQSLMTMNIDSTVWMTRMVLPGMLERKKGAIVNISSASAMYDLPLLAEYSGSKSFIEKFSRALNAEYKAKGVTCQCQIPFYVATKLAKMRKSMMVPASTQFVALAIKWVGHGDCVVSPYLLHAFQGWVLDCLPNFIVAKVIMGMHLATRKRGLKKDAKKAAEKSD